MWLPIHKLLWSELKHQSWVFIMFLPTLKSWIGRTTGNPWVFFRCSPGKSIGDWPCKASSHPMTSGSPPRFRTHMDFGTPVPWPTHHLSWKIIQLLKIQLNCQARSRILEFNLHADPKKNKPFKFINPHADWKKKLKMCMREKSLRGPCWFFRSQKSIDVHRFFNLGSVAGARGSLSEPVLGVVLVELSYEFIELDVQSKHPDTSICGFCLIIFHMIL